MIDYKPPGSLSQNDDVAAANPRIFASQRSSLRRQILVPASVKTKQPKTVMENATMYNRCGRHCRRTK